MSSDESSSDEKIQDPKLIAMFDKINANLNILEARSKAQKN